MSVPSQFLTLSIKDQLWITILILTIFSLVVILCLPGSFSYEILMEDYKRKKKFFYNEYMEYIHTCFYFHSFNILKYEEIIKRMAKQIYKYSTRENIFNYNSDFDYKNDVVQDLSEMEENNDNDENILYEYCYNEDSKVCQASKNKLIDKYESINGLIFSHDIINRFKEPSFEIPIINSFFGVDVNDSIIYGFNKTGISTAFGNFIDYKNINKTKLNKYYKKLVYKQMEYAMNNLMDSLNRDLFLFDKLFNKVITEMNDMEERSYFYEMPREEAFPLYIKAALGHYSIIELSNDKCYLVTHVNDQDKYYYFQFNLIEDYLDHIGKFLSTDQNMNFIPLYSFNHTIMSPGLCVNFLLKQSNDLFNEKVLNNTYYNIQEGISGIEDCFYDKKIFENKKIVEMFDTNITHFLLPSNKIYQGLIKLKEPYFFMKSAFPNLNILKEYQSDYLLINQFDFYLFAPFKDPIEYSNYIKKQYRNLFYLIILLILYIWILCFITNMIIYCRVSKQITEPIYKLQEAIENNNIKDESVFNYEYDDIINELFITCRELLTGHIDTSNSLKYSSQFNILNQQNERDKIIDKNKYEKNLIIDNKIINELINEQQNMMNYKNQIEFNDESNINDIIDSDEDGEEDKREKTYKSKSKNIKDDNKENKENFEIKESIKHNKIEEEDEINKKSYKSLFRLAQYLYYYRCKVEENNITINISSKNDDKKSNIYRINNNQKQNSIRDIRHKKSLSPNGINDKNEDNITINVLKGKDITYLWYMEMKKKNNKSFNYNVSDDLEELFID